VQAGCRPRENRNQGEIEGLGLEGPSPESPHLSVNETSAPSFGKFSFDSYADHSNYKGIDGDSGIGCLPIPDPPGGGRTVKVPDIREIRL
jgi:hypothetical protein